MSTVEMKWEITTSLDSLSDAALGEIHGLVKKLERVASETESMDQTFQRILREDANLLNRLAQ